MAHLKISDTVSIVIYPQMSNKLTVNKAYEHNIQQVTFYIPKVIKNTTTMFHPKPIIPQVFPADEKICPVRNIVEYIKASKKSKNQKLTTELL